jgi:hypothetical protein
MARRIDWRRGFVSVPAAGGEEACEDLAAQVRGLCGASENKAPSAISGATGMIFSGNAGKVTQYHMICAAPKGIPQGMFNHILKGQMQGVDSSTNLSGSPVIGHDDLSPLAGLVERARNPETWAAASADTGVDMQDLTDYVPGIIQLTYMQNKSSLIAHVDPPTYGDIIVTFTTEAIDVKLSRKSGVPELKGAAVTKNVPAGHFYAIRDQVRSYAKHGITYRGQHDGRRQDQGSIARIGVTIRFWHVSLVELLRCDPDPNVGGSSLCAPRGWPQDDNELKEGRALGHARWFDVESRIAYSTVYPVRITNVVSGEAKDTEDSSARCRSGGTRRLPAGAARARGAGESWRSRRRWLDSSAWCRSSGTRRLPAGCCTSSGRGRVFLRSRRRRQHPDTCCSSQRTVRVVRDRVMDTTMVVA